MSIYSALNNQQLVDEFDKIYKESGVSSSNINRFLRNHYSSLYDEIERRTIKLNAYKKTRPNGKLQDISIFERIYCLLHGLSDRPLCKTCNKKPVAGFMPYNNAYADYCSHACQTHSPICIAKQQQTKTCKYGAGRKAIYDKASKTRHEKYGKHHPDSFVMKSRATKKRKYGNEKYVNVEKIKQTVERHKSENPDYYAEREQKTKATKVKNGHDSNWNNRDKFKQTLSSFSDERKTAIKEKRKLTCLDSYGCEFPTQNIDVQNKYKLTCRRLYGVSCTFNIQKSYDNMVYAIRSNAWDQFLLKASSIKPMFTKEEFIAYNSNDKLWRWKCEKCGHEFMHVWKNVYINCPNCVKHDFMGMQNEIFQFIKSICKDDILRENDRKTFKNKIEIDILNQTMQVGIELNGLIWHNIDKGIYGRSRIDMMYHSYKIDMCNSKGIRLIQLFEDEWLEHKKLCKSKLHKIMHPKDMHVIDAQKCNVCSNVKDEDKKKFLMKYTFYGIDKSSIAYSLTMRNRIVAMMTFARRDDNTREWQVINYAEMNNFIVKHGFKTLLNAFCKDMHAFNVMYVVSRDWNSVDDVDGSMTFLEVGLPQMHWMKRHHRFGVDEINESCMQALLMPIDDSKSFVQNMNDNGYYRIYDSGTLIFKT